jgi:hypothetical protein
MFPFRLYLIIYFSLIFIGYIYNYIEFSRNNDTYFPLFYTTLYAYNEWISLDFKWYYNFIFGFYSTMIFKLYFIHNHLQTMKLIKCISIHVIIDTIVEPFVIINFIYSHIIPYIITNTDADTELEYTLNRNIIKSTFIEEKPNCCPVCFDVLTKHDKPLSCGHHIHRKCIVLSKQTRCSICRAEIFLYKKELHTILDYDYNCNYDCNLCISIIKYIRSYIPSEWGNRPSRGI